MLKNETKSRFQSFFLSNFCLYFQKYFKISVIFLRRPNKKILHLYLKSKSKFQNVHISLKICHMSWIPRCFLALCNKLILYVSSRRKPCSFLRNLVESCQQLGMDYQTIGLSTIWHDLSNYVAINSWA